MDRDLVIKNILLSDKEEYTKKSVLHYLKAVTSVDLNKPKYIKKGDVIIQNSNIKNRPFVVIKVFKEYCYAIPMSTTKDEYYLTETRSRFWGEGYFNSSVMAIKHEYCIEKYIGVYDNIKHLNKVIKILKEQLSEI